MNFLSDQLSKYIEQHTSPSSNLLSDINRITHQRVLMPRMISGHLQGRVLSMFSHMIKPSSILEIGTYTGYSALCLAEGLSDNGKLITIDKNVELEEMTRSFFDKSPIGQKIDFRVGNALEIIPKLDMKFDLVFIDADKENYSNYYDLVIDDVTAGGIVIADNVLWSGKVLEDGNDKDTKALKLFNMKIQEDNRVENVLFPVRDGLMVIRKL